MAPVGPEDLIAKGGRRPQRGSPTNGPALLLVSLTAFMMATAANPREGEAQLAALIAEAGSHGTALLKAHQPEQAARAFRLVVRLKPSKQLWLAQYSLGNAMLMQCRCSRALLAYTRALHALRHEHGSALLEATVLKAQATSALPIAKVASNSTYQLQMLNFFSSSLEEAFVLHPEPQSPLFLATLQAKKAGGVHHLLHIASPGECTTLLKKQAAEAMSRGFGCYHSFGVLLATLFRMCITHTSPSLQDQTLTPRP